MRLLRIAALGAFGSAALALLAAWSLDRFVAVTVQPVVRAAPEAVQLNRTLHESGQDVAAIYGVPSGRPMRVLFPSKENVVRPPENPRLRLLLIDKQRGENPLQVKTVWFVAWRLGAGLAVLGALCLGVGFLWRRRSEPPGSLAESRP